MAVPLVVQYANQEQFNNLRLVAAFSELQDGVKLQSGAELSLTSPDSSMQLTQLNTICRYIAEAGSRREQLLGSSPAAKAQTSEWLSFRNTGLSPVTEDRLYKISTHLLTRICLADSDPTLADLCLFATLHRAVASLPAAQAERYCNLIRWFDHMQQTVDTTGVYPKVFFRKPGLPEAVPPAAAATSKPAPAAPKEKRASAAEGTASKEAASKSPPIQPGSNDAASRQAGGKESGSKGAPTCKGPAAKGVGEASPVSAEQPGPQQSAPAQGGKATDPAKEAKKAAKKESRKEAEPKKAEEARIDMLDIRVGKIVEVGPHPTADTLYVEHIDLGEDKPRQVVSGLRKHVSLEEMQGRLVVVCTNLKPAKMREVMSYGMVLCASTAEQVSPLLPPPGVALGTKITVSGYDNEALAEVNPKKKILEKLKPDMATDASGVARYKDQAFTCGGQPVTSTVLTGSVG